MSDFENTYTYLKKQLKFYKEQKNYTIKQIAELAELPESTISKIFAGINKNPTLDTLKKIANVFGCTLDDLLNPNADEAVSPYYYDRKTARLAEEIHKNADLKILMDSTRDLAPEDLNAIIEIVKRIKNK